MYSQSDVNGSGHGPGHSLAWDIKGKPMPSLSSPFEFYTTLFASKQSSQDELKQKIANEKSFLDAVRHDARSLRKRVSKNDADKLDEYFESIRDVEKGLVVNYLG